MRQSEFKTSFILSSIIAVLMALASTGGLLISGVYRDNAFVATLWRGNDLVTLVVAVPLLVASALRVLDIFVLRLDERLGEIILSKALGFATVVVFVWWSSGDLKEIGLHSRLLWQSVFIASVITVTSLVAGYGVELVFYFQEGLDPRVSIGGIDPKSKASGGVLFAAWLMAGNVSFREWELLS